MNHTLTVNERIAAEAYKRYQHSTTTNLKGAYKHPSKAKLYAEHSIMNEIASCDGYGYRIIAHNPNIFSCGYIYTNPETLYATFVYITPTHRREIPIIYI